MLVVISIIGILVALGLSSYSGAQRQARDRQRQSDLNQYRIALENYANRTASSTYPIRQSTNVDTGEGLCHRDFGGITIVPTFMSSCLQDPKYNSSTYNNPYYYVTNASGSSYVLQARMESASSSTPFYVICSNGKSGYRGTSIAGLGWIDCPL